MPAAEARGKITGYKIFYQADSGTEENKEVEEVSALVHITISKQFSWLANTIMSSLIYRIATAGHTAHLPLTNPMWCPALTIYNPSAVYIDIIAIIGTQRKTLYFP